MNNGKLDGKVESTEIGTSEGLVVKQAAVEDDEYTVTSEVPEVEKSSDARKIGTAEDSSEARINTELEQGEDGISDKIDMFTMESIPLEPLNVYLELLTNEEHKSVRIYTKDVTEYKEYNIEKIWEDLIVTISKYETVDIGADFISESTYEIHIEKEAGIIVIELGNEIKITDEMGVVLYQYELLDSAILLKEINVLITGI